MKMHREMNNGKIGAIAGDIAGSRFELDGLNVEIPLVNRYCS